MPTIFSKGGFYLGTDDEDVRNVTKKHTQIHLSIHIWNFRLEYDYMQPSKTDEKHYDFNSNPTVGYGANQTLRSSDGQNLEIDRNNQGTRQK